MMDGNNAYAWLDVMEHCVCSCSPRTYVYSFSFRLTAQSRLFIIFRQRWRSSSTLLWCCRRRVSYLRLSFINVARPFDIWKKRPRIVGVANVSLTRKMEKTKQTNNQIHSICESHLTVQFESHRSISGFISVVDIGAEGYVDVGGFVPHLNFASRVGHFPMGLLFYSRQRLSVVTGKI